MSEGRTKTIASYEYDKTIKNIELNPSYINGLQRITTKYILNLPESDQANLSEVFVKFREMLEFDYSDGKQPKIKLQEWESDLYCLFSLTQYLQSLAADQGIQKTTEVEIKLDDIKDITDAAKSGDIPEELAAKIAELAKKVQSS